MIDICLAGTGGTIPLKNRWLSSCFIEYLGKAALIDCGEGTQIALSQSNCKISKLDILIITHFHADHISGLPGLLLTLGNTGKLTPLKIYGPSGIMDVVNKLRCICPVLPYELEIIELDIIQTSRFEWNGIQVSSLPLLHNIPCLGFSFVLKRKPV